MLKKPRIEFDVGFDLKLIPNSQDKHNRTVPRRAEKPCTANTISPVVLEINIGKQLLKT